jgi:predicted nucleic acid-binding protein
MRTRRADAVFVDTGAWIALALLGDPLHPRAVEAWDDLLRQGTRLATSVPVMLETFTFLDRNAARDVAIAWKDAIRKVPFLRTLECTTRDLAAAWLFFERRDLHKLSAVDATSFVLMTRERIRRAFTFDHHFATVGFQLIG